MPAPSKPERLPNGQFPPGKSGNPAGRPRTESAALRARLAEQGEAVARVVIDKALAGDMHAAKLILDRLAPPLKPCAVPVSLEVPSADSPLALAQGFITAAAAGQLPPDIAAQLVAATAQLCRVKEVEELRDRLDAIERAINPRKP